MKRRREMIELYRFLRECADEVFSFILIGIDVHVLRRSDIKDYFLACGDWRYNAYVIPKRAING
jgi:hypothetical protein